METASLRIKFTPLIQTTPKNSSNFSLEIVTEVSCIQNMDKIQWHEKADTIEYTVPMTYKIILRKRHNVKEIDSINHLEKVYHSCVDLMPVASLNFPVDIMRIMSDTFIYYENFKPKYSNSNLGMVDNNNFLSEFQTGKSNYDCENDVSNMSIIDESIKKLPADTICIKYDVRVSDRNVNASRSLLCVHESHNDGQRLPITNTTSNNIIRANSHMNDTKINRNLSCSCSRIKLGNEMDANVSERLCYKNTIDTDDIRTKLYISNHSPRTITKFCSENNIGCSIKLSKSSINDNESIHKILSNNNASCSKMIFCNSNISNFSDGISNKKCDDATSNSILFCNKKILDCNEETIKLNHKNISCNSINKINGINPGKVITNNDCDNSFSAIKQCIENSEDLCKETFTNKTCDNSTSCSRMQLSKESSTDSDEIIEQINSDNVGSIRKLSVTPVFSIDMIESPIYDNLKFMSDTLVCHMIQTKNVTNKINLPDMKRLDYNYALTEKYIVKTGNQYSYSKENHFIYEHTRMSPEVRVSNFVKKMETEIMPLKIILQELIQKCTYMGLIKNKSVLSKEIPFQCKQPTYCKFEKQINCNRVVYSVVFDG